MTTYLTDSYGKFIPASQRPDGTWRKARRVRNGYVPQEEVPLYESKGKQFAQRRSMLPPGLYPSSIENTTKQLEISDNSSNKVKSQTRQTAGLLKLPSVTDVIVKPQTVTPQTVVGTTKKKNKKSSSETSAKSGKPSKSKAIENSINEVSEMVVTQLHIDNGIDDTAKKLKRLRKKLREIEQLEEKIKTGVLKKPDKDQLDKLKRKQQVRCDLEALELLEAAKSNEIEQH